MKIIFGWIAVVIVIISFLIQYWTLLDKEINFKWLITIEVLLIISSIFWMLYSFLGEIYWPVAINNIFVCLFNFAFLILNIMRWKKSKIPI